jgi:Protein of unknown function (DUF4232)
MNLRARPARRIGAVLALALPAALAPALARAQPSTPQPATAHPAAAPGCQTPGLVIWLDTQGNGTAGSIYYNLEFTNLSGQTCTLNGFPFINGVNLAGKPLGSSASFNHIKPPHVVTLTNGTTAKAVLQIVDTGAFPPSSCKPVTAAGLQVFPPNQTRSKTVPFPFGACSLTGPVYLTVQPVTK